jgi:predicted DCC family thiol-disulfide oxidoreductase YuxK
MKTALHYPLTIYYDAACPVCALEMDHLRDRDHAGQLRLVDISAAGFDATAHGLEHERLGALLHARAANGELLIGVPALAAAYGAVGLGALWQPALTGPLVPLAEAAYASFARHRRSWSRALAPGISALRQWRAWRAERTHARMQACQGSTCERGPNEPSAQKEM